MFILYYIFYFKMRNYFAEEWIFLIKEIGCVNEVVMEFIILDI